MGVIEALLVIVIIGILAFTGWYVVKAKNNSNKSLNSATSASQNTPATSSTASTQLPSGSDNQSLQSDLSSIDTSQNQAASDNSSAGTALNDQQNEISVPTN